MQLAAQEERFRISALEREEKEKQLTNRISVQTMQINTQKETLQSLALEQKAAQFTLQRQLEEVERKLSLLQPIITKEVEEKKREFSFHLF